MDSEHRVKGIIERHLEKCENALAVFAAGKFGNELQDSWEIFLNEFGKVIDKSIELGLRNPHCKQWAHKLKNRLKNKDELITYLKEARNLAEHSLSVSTNFSDPGVNIGGMHIRGDKDVRKTMQFNNSFILSDHSLFITSGDASISTGGGLPPSIEGNFIGDARILPPNVELLPIYSDVKKTTFPIPTTVNAQPITENRTLTFARHGLVELNELVDFLRQHFPNP